MWAAFSFNRDKFQAEPPSGFPAAYHGVGSYGAFLHQKMQIGYLTFRKGLFRFQKQSARAHIADSRHVCTRNALPVDPNLAVCFDTRGESSARTYADQTLFSLRAGADSPLQKIENLSGKDLKLGTVRDRRALFLPALALC